jgi:uncharacterized protein YbjQ (UPF0145 family)
MDHNGGDDDQDALLRSLQEQAAEEPGQALVIGEGDFSSDLANATNDPLPGGDYLQEAGFDANMGNPESQDLFAAPSDLREAGADALGDLGGLSDPGDFSGSFTEDPLQDVDSLLASEVLGDADFAAAEFLSAAPESLPTFQVQLSFVDPSLKPKLKDLASAQGLVLTDSAWANATPVISQLTEYQAALLQRAARALGASVHTRVHFPMGSPTEDDLALGDLSSVPDPVQVISEGAPSVILPSREKDVMLFSGDAIPGFAIVETKGPVTAHRSIARRLFAQEEAAEKLRKELERFPGRHNNAPSSRLQQLFRELFGDLQKQALVSGGNAVLSIRLQSFSERDALDPGTEQLRLLVIGTAAVVEKSS